MTRPPVLRATALRLPLPLLAALFVVTAVPARAQLRIEITSGVTDPVPIAVVPLDTNGSTERCPAASVAVSCHQRGPLFWSVGGGSVGDIVDNAVSFGRSVCDRRSLPPSRAGSPDAGAS